MLAIMKTRQAFVRALALLATLGLGAGCSDDAPPGEEVDAGVPDPLVDMLNAIDGVVTVTELSVPRTFEIRFEQPVNHGNPDGPRFTQKLTLVHQDFAAPMVVASTGYHDYLGFYSTEPTYMLEANQVVIEHRFFGGSRPLPPDWNDLDIEQAAADHHRVITAFKSLYTGAWISTGGSKGGMASVFHRRFYPDDVDGTVAYVAPISFSADDTRYEGFFDGLDASLGDDCVERVREIQRQALIQRDAMEEYFAGRAASIGYRFERMGGLPRAFETAVVELEWTFWQYSSASACSSVPDATASVEEISAFIEQTEVVWSVSDQHLETFEAYYYQAATEMGYPSIPHAHLDDLLQFDYEASAVLILPDRIGPVPPHDPAPMRDIADWLAREGERIIFIYGAQDPWTAGKVELGEARDSYVYVVPDGNHGTSALELDEAERQRFVDTLSTWTGTPVEPLSIRTIDQAERGAPRFVRHPRPRLGL
jgi:hypothetical protein